MCFLSTKSYASKIAQKSQNRSVHEKTIVFPIVFCLTAVIKIAIICLKPFIFLLVDEEDEYECVSVVNSHTQDVKHVVWHPTQEV